MAGIFRYNTSNATPKKRPTLSPFCTSPGQLQDVTMDSSYAMGYRSPPFNVPVTGGNTSPGQGRSIREHDEQLNALRKENFNLKLRIYFMEEKNAATNMPESSDTLFKENVDLKVQAEALRVELKEKQNLLCEAATALELMEQSQKSREEACQSTIDELNTKIQFLEMEIQSMEKNRDNTSCIDYQGQSIVECDLKMQSSAQGSDVQCFESTEQMMQIEQLLKQKEQEVEMWEKKYQKINEELTVLKEKLSNETHNSTEKCPVEHGSTLSASKYSAALSKLNRPSHSNDIRLKIISEQSRLLQQLHNENVNKQKIIDDSKKQLAVYEGHVLITERHNKHLFDENKMLKDFMYELEQHKIRSKARKMQEQLLKSKHNTNTSWSCSII